MPTSLLIKIGLSLGLAGSLVAGVWMAWLHYEGLLENIQEQEATIATKEADIQALGQDLTESRIETRNLASDVLILQEFSQKLAEDNDHIQDNKVKIEKVVGAFNHENIKRWRKKISLDDINRNLHHNVDGMLSALEASSRGEVFEISDYMPEAARTADRPKETDLRQSN